MLAVTSEVTVSCVMATYNGARTIERAIACLQSQTRADWELIIVVDGSTDNTVQVVNAACSADPRIRMIQCAENHGPAGARNRGIAEARGEWLLFLDDDDTVVPQFLDRMLARCSAGDVDCVMTGYVRVDEHGRSFGRFPVPDLSSVLQTCVLGPPAAIHAILTRRAMVVTAGGFDETLRIGEDWDLWLRLAQAGVRFAELKGFLALYHSDGASLTSDGATMLESFGKLLAKAKSSLGQSLVDDQSIADQLMASAFWSAGVAIGRNEHTDGLARHIPPNADWRGLGDFVAQRFIEGLAVGARLPWHRLYETWNRRRPALDAFLAGLQRSFGDDFDGFAITQVIEFEILRAGRYWHLLAFETAIGVPVTPARLWHGVDDRAGADMLVLRLPGLRPSHIFTFGMPRLGRVSGMDMVRAIAHVLGQRLAGTIAERPFAADLRARASRLIRVGRRLLRIPASVGGRAPAAASLREAAAASEQAAVRTDATDRIPRVAPPPPPVDHPGSGATAADWEAFFAREDPWDYDNGYEQLKYRRTLDVATSGAPGKFAKALEIACAEGRFTAMLAPECGTLTAIDISQTALDRAAVRTTGIGNIEFAQRDVFRDGIVGEYDLITCSEVLYYLPKEPLGRLAEQIGAALRPGGRFVHAHAYQLVDSPDRTAFDWDDHVGAQSIFEAFRDTPGLAHRQTIQTELYRIDLFEKGAAAAPVIETVPLESRLSDDVAASVVWNGAIRTRAAVAEDRCYSVPVLMLPPVARADEIPAPGSIGAGELERYLRFLRRRGFRSLGVDEWEEAARNGGSVKGRPILLTFDGIDRDFAETAWPLVKRNGFGALGFVATDEIAEQRDASDRLDWRGLATLVEDGLEVASQLARQTPVSILPAAQLLDEAIRSRLALEAMTGAPVRWVAPFDGITDRRVGQLLVAAGYSRIFLAEGAQAPVTGMWLKTPRIRIEPGMTLSQLAGLIGVPDETADTGDA